MRIRLGVVRCDATASISTTVGCIYTRAGLLAAKTGMAIDRSVYFQMYEDYNKNMGIAIWKTVSYFSEKTIFVAYDRVISVTATYMYKQTR